MPQRSCLLARKKVRHHLRVGLITGLIAGSFLFAGNVKALTDPLIYQKPSNGTLTATEWNNLLNDFVAYRDGGRVGIGTTTPAYDLDVVGAISGKYSVIDGNYYALTNTFATFHHKNLTGAGQYALMQSINGDTYLNAALNRGVWFNINNTSKMVIAGNGDVGIGTTTPDYKLDVSGTGRFTQPVLVGTPTAAGHATTKSYVDSTIGGGSGSTVGYWTMNGANINNSNTGNVGIGTATPLRTVDVFSTASMDGVRVQAGNGSLLNSYAGILLSSSQNGSESWYQSAIRSINTAASPTYLNPRLGFFTQDINTHLIGNMTEKMSILSNGNVGIGTTGPTTKLHVNDSAQVIMKLQSTGAQAYFRTDSALNFNSAYEFYENGGLKSSIYFDTIAEGLKFYESAGDRMIIKNGNVGIGNAAPGYKLDVSGTGRFTQPVLVATPTLDGHAATKNYVDSTIGGGSGSTVGYWTMNGTNISNSNTGNVGIGTTAPGVRLQTQIAAYGYPSVSGTTQTYGQLRLSSEQTGTVLDAGVASGASWIQSTASSNLASSGYLLLNPNGGNVGIGTTAPGGKLTVLGAAGVDAFIQATTAAAGSTFNDGLMMGMFSDSIAYILNREAGDLRFGTNNAEAIRIDSAGNIGIGAIAPSYKLDVSGTGQFTQPVLVGTPTAAGHATTKSYVDSTIGGGSGSTVGYWTMNGTNISNSNTGNVGIGTTAPDQLLDVRGNLSLGRRSTGALVRYIGLVGTNGLFSSFNGQGTTGIILNQEAGGNSSIQFKTGEWAVSENIRMTINHAGNVGIGTVNPRAPLHISKVSTVYQGAGTNMVIESTNGYPGLTFSDNGDSVWMLRAEDTSDNDLYLWRNAGSGVSPSWGSIIAFDRSTGNVGIGTTAPAYKLDVSGTGQFTQPVLVGTPTAAGHATTKSYVDSAAGGGVAAGTSGQTLRHDGTSWVANSTLYNNGANVGIGTTNPKQNLTVSGSSNSEGIGIGPNGGVVWPVLSRNGTDGGLLIKSYNDSNQIYTTNVAITSGGSVGIGTTAPSTKLEVKSINNTSGQRTKPFNILNITSDYNGGDGQPYTGFGGGISFNNESYNGSFYNSAAIYGIIGDDSVLTTKGGSLAFYTSDTKGADLTEKMRIAENGNVGIGTTTPAYTLDVSGTGQFTQPILIGTPTAAGHATTKSYVDSTIGGGSGSTVGYWTMTGTNISNSNTGNVGIGTTEPVTKLSVDSGVAKTDTTFTRMASFKSSEAYASNPLELRIAQRGSATASSQAIELQVGHYGVDYSANLLLQPLGGNVGIGTTSPSAKLHLYDSASVYGHLQTSSVSDANLRFSNANQNWAIGIDGSASNSFKLSASTQTGVSDLITILTTGNVGIGTAAPGYKLDVSGTGRFTQPVLVGTPTAAGHATTKSYVDSTIGGGSGSTVGYWTMNGTNISNSNTGNVGIGTTAPGAKLDVQGADVGATKAIIVRNSAGTDNFSVSNNGQVNIQGSTNIVPMSGGSAYIQIRNNATGYMTVQGDTSYGLLLNPNGGNVGIGTTNPVSKLTVTTGTDTSYNDGALKVIGNIALNSANNLNPSLNRWALRARPDNQEGAFDIYDARNSLSRLLINSSGNIGIGTTTPGYKLDVSGTGQFTQPVLVGTPTAAGHATTKSYVDSASGGGIPAAVDGSTLRASGTVWAANTNLYNDGSRIGIGTAMPGSLLTLANNGWLSARNSADTGIVNMFKVNTNNQIEVGAPLLIGPLEFAPDSGLISLVDMPVTSASVAGSPQGYVMKIDGNNLLSLYSESNGSGGVQNMRLGVGTTTPAYTLDVSGTSRFTQPVLVGTPTAAGHATTKSYVDSTIGGGSGSTVGYWTMNGTNISNSNTGNVGIGTSNPASKLYVMSAASPDIILHSSDANRFESGRVRIIETASTYMGGYIHYNGLSNIFNIGVHDAIDSDPANDIDAISIPRASGNVGIGTTAPAYKLDVSGTGRFTQPVLVGAPTADGHAATRSYVDSAVGGGSGSTVGYWTMSGTNISNSNTGNVGIGTTGPGGLLHIAKSSAGAGVGMIIQNTSATTLNSSADINFGVWSGNATGGGKISVINTNAPTGATDMAFSIWKTTGSTYEAMRINNAGNVGIATTAPAYKLDVSGTGRFTQPVLVGTPTAAGHAVTKSYVDSTAGGGVAAGASGQTLRHDGTSWIANSTLYNSGTNIGVGTTAPGVKMEVQRVETVNRTSYNDILAITANATTMPYSGHGGGIVFKGTTYRSGTSNLNYARIGSTLNDSSVTTAGSDLFFDVSPLDDGVLSRAMTIKYSGSVGIGTTAPAYTLDVSGTGRFTQPVLVGTPTAAGHATTKSYVDSTAVAAAGGGIPAAVNGYTLRASGTSWIANSNLYNNGTNVGIGTTAPVQKLDIAGAIKIANTTATCNADQTGTIKYDSVSGQSYLCDGTRWLNQKNCGIMTDDEGNTYGTVQIGGQCWMAENINIGTMLPSPTSEPTTTDQVIEKWCYNDSSANCETGGGLYNWNEAMRGSTVPGARGICPTGWHIPTDAEYNQLEKTVLGVIDSSNPQYNCDLNYSGWERCADNSGTATGGTYGVGASLKTVGLGSGVGAGNDLVGFAAKLPGYRDTNGTYYYLGSGLFLWSSTESSSTSAWRRLIYSPYSTVFRYAYAKTYGFSVRCLRD